MQMSQSSTRSLPALSSTRMLRRSLFALYSRHMTQSSRKTDWIQIVTNHICASCLDWAIRRTLVSLCTKASNCCLGSWGFRLSSTLKKMEFRTLRETSVATTGLDLTTLQYLDQGTASAAYQDAHLSIRCMMSRMRVSEQADHGRCRGPLRHAFSTARAQCINCAHRAEQRRGRLRGSLPNLQSYGLALYNNIEAG